MAPYARLLVISVCASLAWSAGCSGGAKSATGSGGGTASSGTTSSGHTSGDTTSSGTTSSGTTSSGTTGTGGGASSSSSSGGGGGIAALSDGFDGTALDPSWTVFNPSAVIVSVGGSSLSLKLTKP